MFKTFLKFGFKYFDVQNVIKPAELKMLIFVLISSTKKWFLGKKMATGTENTISGRILKVKFL